MRPDRVGHVEGKPILDAMADCLPEQHQQVLLAQRDLPVGQVAVDESPLVLALVGGVFEIRPHIDEVALRRLPDRPREVELTEKNI